MDYNRGNSGSDGGLCVPGRLWSGSEGAAEQKKEEELSVGRGINAVCCCGSVCLCSKSAARLPSGGALTMAEPHTESLDS